MNEQEKGAREKTNIPRNKRIIFKRLKIGTFRRNRRVEIEEYLEITMYKKRTI